MTVEELLTYARVAVASDADRGIANAAYISAGVWGKLGDVIKMRDAPANLVGVTPEEYVSAMGGN